MRLAGFGCCVVEVCLVIVFHYLFLIFTLRLASLVWFVRRLRFYVRQFVMLLISVL